MFDLRDVHGEYLSAKGKVFDLRDVHGEYLSAKGKVSAIIRVRIRFFRIESAATTTSLHGQHQRGGQEHSDHFQRTHHHKSCVSLARAGGGGVANE